MTKRNISNTTFGKDSLYSRPKNKIDKFAFNQQVVDVFPDMINRSVPSYQNICEGIGKIAANLCPQNPIIYDLGCSLGNTSLAIAKYTFDKSPTIMGIDNSSAMLARCRQHISTFNYGQCIELQLLDVAHINFKPCDLVVINFTLQFLPPETRQTVINDIHNALGPNGALIISEKIRHEDANLNRLLIELHHDFKKENGYSDLEISQKRSALEDVMKLDSIAAHKTRLENAGFTKIAVWYQHFNFLSLIAIK